MPRARKVLAKRNPYSGRGVYGATFVIGAETGGNTKAVGIQLTGANGEDVASRQVVGMYLSDDANGDSVIAVAPSGAVAVGTDGTLMVLEAKKQWRVISEADGDIDFTIVEAAAKTLYVVLIMPDGSVVVSGAVTFA